MAAALLVSQSSADETAAALGYTLMHWTEEEGLPTRTVTALAQTPDGYLWGGSAAGLFRYDGMRFRTFFHDEVPELSGVDVLEMRCDAEGRLWVVGLKGEVVSYHQGRFRRWISTDGVPNGGAGKLGTAMDGRFWFKSRTGDAFYRFNGKSFDEVTVDGVAARDIDRFLTGPEGLMWGVRETDRRMVRLDGKPPELVPLRIKGIPNWIKAGRFLLLSDGTPAVTSTHGVFVLRDGAWEPELLLRNTKLEKLLGGVRDARGLTWISSYGDGLFVVRQGGAADRLMLPQFARSVFHRDLLAEPNGNVWVAGSEGLYRLRPNAFHTPGYETTADSLAMGFVESTSGTMTVLHPNGWRIQSGDEWREVQRSEKNCRPVAGTTSADGSLLMAFRNLASVEGRLERVTSDGQVLASVLMKGSPRVIAGSGDNTVWIGGLGGLWRWDTNGMTAVSIPNTPADVDVRGLVVSRDGTLWAGCGPAGLHRRDASGRWEKLMEADVRGLYLDASGVLWIACDAGLARWHDGQLRVFSGLGFQGTMGAESVATDDCGGVWASTTGGVMWLDRASLEAEESVVRSEWYDQRDGLPSGSCQGTQNDLFRSRDGRIWIATYGGAAWVNPSELRQRREMRGTAPLEIETVTADSVVVLDRARTSGGGNGATLQLPAGTRRVELGFVRLDLSGMRGSSLRYRLAGLSDDWSAAEAARSAVYHSLPPGDYRFQLSAADGGKAALAFAVLPQWWQRRTVQMAAALMLLAAAWGFYHRRMSALREHARMRADFSRELIRSQEAERKRIASELHDGLGQELLVMKNLAGMGRAANDADADAGNQFAEIADTAGKALEEVRAISRALRPPELDRLGLTEAIRAMVDRVAESSGLEFNDQIDDVDGVLSADQEIAVFRILQEALNNAVKHSGAKGVRLEIKQSDSCVEVAVSDDGHGFDPLTVKSGVGFRSLRERADLAGGVLDIQSQSGQGTTVRLRVSSSANT